MGVEKVRVFSFIPSSFVVLFVVGLIFQTHSDTPECYPLSGLYDVLVWWSSIVA